MGPFVVSALWVGRPNGAEVITLGNFPLPSQTKTAI